jgi:NAD-dependent dihydropyrimidine dehydrogenase PreA subunit
MGGGATPEAGAEMIPPGPNAPMSKEQELEALKLQARQLEEQLQAISARLREAEHGGAIRRLLAVVDPEQCTACRICQEVCPVNAISVENVARIDGEACTGCGQCVVECPQGAISLKKC